MKVKGIKKVSAILLSLLLVGMLMPVMYVKADGDIEINETNFPDENFRNFITSTYAITDGKLTSAVIAGVTTIDCHEQNIASLKGIGYFTALEKLNCNLNNLTELDVSSNTKLEELQCNNYNENNNKLTSLNVGNTNIKTLDCSGNDLTKLDVSGLTAIETLHCSSNQLTSLIGISNKEYLKEIDCSGNQLTSIDVSGDTALKKLDCYSNQLGEIKIGANTTLETLDCHSNKLTSLDVSASTALKNLDCKTNQLTSLKLNSVCL